MELVSIGREVEERVGWLVVGWVGFRIGRQPSAEGISNDESLG